MPSQKLGFQFENTYTKLPDPFFVRQNPVPVRSPKIAVFNHSLAESLGLNAEILQKEGADLFAGNGIPSGADPIAQAYAGHQFGHFTMLGDGRAILLGEHIAPQGARFDIQLKGSGPTPFSRNGDGRAALGPMLREYIISEAMAGLGIPTTRSLAVVTTGEITYREKPLPGAILTRVASSHIRVGTFQFAAALKDPQSVRSLADYTLGRHFSELVSTAEPYLSMLSAVIERQASLLAKWMNVGFIHGVMNTDNMALSGETIDYGPCAFMNQFSPTTVFSSIDRNGRYAYGNQPRIAEWNLARLAEVLLPLLHENQEQALEKAKEALSTFAEKFKSHWLQGMRAKLGLLTSQEGDASLMEDLLKWMEKNNADFTNTFRALCSDSLPASFDEAEFSHWRARWELRRSAEPSEESARVMRAANPVVIPRNHRVEEALEAAVEREDYSVMENLLAALKAPYEETGNLEFREPPPGGESGYRTYCGT